MRIFALLLLLAGPIACNSEQSPSATASPEEISFELVASPVGPASMAPNFSSSGQQLLLSWIERSEDSAKVRFARHGSATGWSDPVTIVERSDLFVNWADFPSVIADDSGTLYAHWLQKSAPRTYAYDVMMAVSEDGGATWSEPFVLHDDGTPTEHGFASMSPHPDGGIAVTWLDVAKWTAAATVTEGET